jgi:hypothetical protein
VTNTQAYSFTELITAQNVKGFICNSLARPGAAQIDTKLASLLAIFKNRPLIKRNSFVKKF